MNPIELTLEQMEEREANRVAFQKAKAEKAIAKLTERALKADEKDVKRLDRIITTFKSHVKILDKTDAKKEAKKRFDKIQERMKPVIQ